MRRAGPTALAGVLSLITTLSQPLPVTLGAALAWAGGVVLGCVFFAVAGYCYLVDVRRWGPPAPPPPRDANWHLEPDELRQ